VADFFVDGIGSQEIQWFSCRSCLFLEIHEGMGQMFPLDKKSKRARIF
jgi:hypothetical protein